ncbi:dual specificity protein phosphatase DSP8 [Canna indica]|uniref:phosphatidylglycerophosphatase n=1 Tax=Canna indica TaxID=4628 RepID=A0AAQ3Q7U0_9LILI|nr:dual specificity protein phosphatase DSP8 [Canna indica]
MRIEELGEQEADGGGEGERSIGSVRGGNTGLLDAKRAVVGIGGRILFYPTLVYNVMRNMLESEFHWWDQIDEFLLLGAVPFPSDVPRLKKLGVCGVITLNEPFETLVPTSLYHAHGIEHLLIPTRDYLFAPSFGNISLAVDFIHKNATCGRMTYVHCKAGRGRSTTIVLCYLVQHKQMTPTAAYQYVKLIRPRVRLASSQWKAVQDFYHLIVQKAGGRSIYTEGLIVQSPVALSTKDFVDFDDSSFEVVSRSEIDGYDRNMEGRNAGQAELNLANRVQITAQAALARLSYFYPLIVQKNAGRAIYFDDSSFEVVSQSEIDEYDRNMETCNVGNAIWGLAYRVQITGKASLARLYYSWNRSLPRRNSSRTIIPVT